MGWGKECIQLTQLILWTQELLPIAQFRKVIEASHFRDLDRYKLDEKNIPNLHTNLAQPITTRNPPGKGASEPAYFCLPREYAPEASLRESFKQTCKNAERLAFSGTLSVYFFDRSGQKSKRRRCTAHDVSRTRLRLRAQAAQKKRDTIRCPFLNLYCVLYATFFSGGGRISTSGLPVCCLPFPSAISANRLSASEAVSLLKRIF